MDHIRSLINQNKQQRYRKSQSGKGLVRFEIQVSKETKERFDAMVNEAAKEFITPQDTRQRIAKARARVFDELTNNLGHDFFTLRDQIDQLKAEVKALSPTFFETSDYLNTPLPEAVSALDDDPKKLKQLLATT
jgi:hypothetical protein